MTSPEPITEPAPVAPALAVGLGGSDARLRTELVHRHLVARVAAARRQVEELDQQRRDERPEQLVASVGATVVEVRRRLSIERADAELRAEAFERAARRRGAEIIAEAEAEARVLRAAAAWVRQVRLSGPESSPATTLVTPVAVAVAAPLPVLAAVEARAS